MTAEGVGRSGALRPTGDGFAVRIPAISADGRYVAFTSYASNLVAGDTNKPVDVFVRNQIARVTRRVGGSGRRPGQRFSEGNLNQRSPQTAATWHSTRMGRTWSLVTPTAPQTCSSGTAGAIVDRRVSVGPGGLQANNRFSGSPALSADGRYVAFYSCASNLVAGDTNGTVDVFVRDRRPARPRGYRSVQAVSKPTKAVGCRRSPQTAGYVAFDLGRIEPGGRRHQRRLRTCSSVIGCAPDPASVDRSERRTQRV